MRQRSPDYIRNNEDLYLRVPPVEDGNTPENTLDQGFIYTAESIDQNFYDTEYSSPITSITSRRPETGVNYVYEIAVSYTATEAPTSNTPGLYGSNLINKGDFFTITSLNDTHDYIRGVVIDVLNIEVPNTPGPGDVWSYTYNLLCNINEGDPLLIEDNDNFVWKRRIFSDATNEILKSPPTNLLSTVRTDGVYFKWIDPTESAIRYNLRVREKNESDGSGIQYFSTSGIRANGDGQINLQPFIGSTGSYLNKISTIKILNAGDQYSFSPEINIIGTGTGATALSFVDEYGSLKKETFRIYDADPMTGEVFVVTQNWESYPSVTSYTEGMSTEVFVESTSDLGYGKHSLTFTEVDGTPFGFTAGYASYLIDKDITVHTGIALTNAGNNYKRLSYARPKVYESEDIYHVKKSLTGSTGTLSYGDYYWSVCSIFKDDSKSYTEWSPEQPLTVY